MKKKQYLLISAKPAPNGQLHLGHLSGPYLSQDMYYRKLCADGHDVKVISGTDAIDSFIQLKAVQQGVQPAHLAAQHFATIVDSFAGFSIHYDNFINPFSEQWQPRYVATMQEVVTVAEREGKVITKEAPFPENEAGEPASGAWIEGICCDCDSPMSGYFCEQCGAHLEPGEILDARHRNTAHTLCFEPQSDVFFQIADSDGLLQSLQQAQVREQEYAIVEKQFQNNRTQVRLTERAAWGVSCGDNQQVYFGHGMLYAYCRMIGESYQALTGCQTHPFDAESEVTTINFFGMDNTVSHMVNINAIGAEIPQWKGFDHFVVNQFYLLNGRKFSTSAGHVVNGNEVISNPMIQAEGVRFVLAATSPAKHTMDFTQASLLHWYNNVLINELMQPLVMAAEQLSGKTWPVLPAGQDFAPVWEKLTHIYEYHNFDPQEVVAIARDYIATGAGIKREDALAQYLAQSALLLYPLIPETARTLWQACGLSGDPSLAGLACDSAAFNAFPCPFERISMHMIDGLFR
ncbi:class I tRNA ligase family protein [Pseudoalteromonas rubra]|uniref:Class I tRNA ligase family protein n=1 Tax=Pseudoalteromonas rubra TaxID=43658 RepID=A0A5S3UUV7_9GAMM|nr:class I tRNA ligase family protein [Pseudoalteromonas rubra]QPB82419.1 class I tRNA ligase family protein [Pseudoalteromonas rubra]